MLLTRKQFCQAIEIQEKHLPVYYKRGKIVYDINDNSGLIDTENPINATFLKKMCNKKGLQLPKNVQNVTKSVIKKEKVTKKTKQVPELIPEIPKSLPTIKKISVLPTIGIKKEMPLQKIINTGAQNEKNIDNYFIEQKLKTLDAERRSNEIKLQEMKIEKQAGEVVPSALIKPVIIRLQHSFMIAFKNTLETILTEFAKIKEFSNDEISEMRGKIILEINNSMEVGTNISIGQIEKFVTEYSKSRGIGEKK